MRGIRKLLSLFFAFSIIGLAGIGTAVLFAARGLPDPSQLNEKQFVQSTKIYDRAGEILLYEIHGEEKRTVVPYEEIPEYVRLATLAIEDQNFYGHPAFDLKGIARGIWVGITTGRFQGGSTITQQLTRNSFLTPERTLIRKFKELILALELERQYTKDEIFHLYLNQIPYGSNAYGVEAASRLYFGKSVQDVNLAEAAILASLINRPTYYSPWGSHTDELKKRQEYVLSQMLKLNFIDEEEFERAKGIKLSDMTVPQRTEGILAPHFVMAVQNYLVKKYGEDAIEKGGLKITTTIDWKLQQIAEKAVIEGALRNENLYKAKNAALLAQDAATGQILAMVGSRNYYDIQNEGNFNVATQGFRQPGSAFKPFVYYAALQKGFTPDSIVFDVPTEFVPNNPNCPPEVNFNNSDPQCYHPQNYDEKFRGPVTFRQALAQSLNIPSVKVLYLAGLDNALAVTKNFGISTLTERSRYGLSLVLGGGEVKLSELVNAYSVLAQDGVKNEQVMILKVEDANGNILEEYKYNPTQIADPQIVRQINDILSDENARRPLFQNSFSQTVVPGHQIALKTGTTNDYRDAWAIGYTPDLVVGVWAGNNNPSELIQTRGGSILAAIPIWHAFISETLKEKELKTFPRPEQNLTQKPILNGNFAPFGQIHDTLYYVQKNNPAGPPPENPYSDPQFNNWEMAALSWARANPFSLPQIQKQSSLEIEFLTPKNGDWITEILPVSVSIKSSSAITKIEIRLNNALLDSKIGNFNPNIKYDIQLWVQNLLPQNELLITAANADGVIKEKKLILYN